MKSYILRLGKIGTPGLSNYDARRVRLTNYTALTSLLITSGYVAFYLTRGWYSSILFNITVCVLQVVAMRLNAAGHHRLGPGFSLGALTLQVAAIPALFLGAASGIHFFLFMIPTLSFLLLHRRDRIWMYFQTLLAIGLFTYVEYGAYTSPWWVAAPPDLLRILHAASTIATILSIMLIVLLYHIFLNQAQDDLQREHERSESLLLNILPPTIAERLKRNPETIADDFAETTVFFADIVGFTPWAASNQPARVVGLLNRYFTAFDELIERYQVEKIKTSGDAYIAAAGLPEPRVDHAQVIMELAIDILQNTRKLSAALDTGLDIRIGICSGPVTAGVIGTHKFVYDIWGDTVNTAARMESFGIPGHIQVSESTYSQLEGRFAFAERGPVEIKGKGLIRTFIWQEGTNP